MLFSLSPGNLLTLGWNPELTEVTGIYFQGNSSVGTAQLNTQFLQ